MLNLDFLSI